MDQYFLVPVDGLQLFHDAFIEEYLSVFGVGDGIRANLDGVDNG